MLKKGGSIPKANHVLVSNGPNDAPTWKAVFNPVWSDNAPSPDDLEREDFNAIWEVIKSWDINVPDAYNGYCGANGNHVKHILDALDKMKKHQSFLEVMKLNKRKLEKLLKEQK